ncbi:aminoglycoside N(3)-acetyltransferase [Fontibacillus sp. BL9]|uniref:aminoglycoside N(3)-acetyltransferase n=1 Tax=Fontibacillus sp. BL9 TaxID=3389971 RepID=UPI00397DB3BF
MEEIQGTLITVATLRDDLAALGVEEGMTLLVHSSFNALGKWVAGGPVAVILALEEVLGERGTLVVPTHSNDLSDPSGWENPPVPAEWWERIREQMPAYDPDLTPLWHMGVIPELFRKQGGVKRSGHPHVSFAARGVDADLITGDHGLDYGLGERSPLARIYDAEGWVLLLGVGHANNTSIHLAEYRADYPGKKETVSKAPMIVNGRRQWGEFRDIETDSGDFERIGTDFEQATGKVIRGNIAGAAAMLMPQKALVDYATEWMKLNRSFENPHA